MTQSRILASVQHHLKTVGIDHYLSDDNVTEIMLNPDGNLWIERFGQPCQLSHTVLPAAAHSLMNAIASSVNTIVDSRSPILECELLTDGSRFEGTMPPIVPNVSFTLRKKATRIFTLEEYLASQIMTQAQYDAVIHAIKHHQNILVVGGTASGKTTLVNALLQKMATLFPDERHIILEDTNELQTSAKNCVVFRTHPTANVGMRELLRATLRYRPDRIIVGEVRGGEALDLLKAWNTGHSGGIATIHANSAPLGLARLEQCIEEVANKANPHMIAATVHTLIFIEKTPHGRRVRDICTVSGVDTENGGYLTQSII